MKISDSQLAEMVDKNGRVVIAQTYVCSECEGDTFNFLLIENHHHIRCVECGASFCNGHCNDHPKIS